MTDNEIMRLIAKRNLPIANDIESGRDEVLALVDPATYEEVANDINASHEREIDALNETINCLRADACRLRNQVGYDKIDVIKMLRKHNADLVEKVVLEVGDLLTQPQIDTLRGSLVLGLKDAKDFVEANVRF